MKIKPVPAILLIIVVLLGLSAAVLTLMSPAIGSSFSKINANFAADERYALMPASAGEIDGTTLVGGQPEQPQDAQERIILRDATINIIVSDVSLKIGEIGGMAEEMGGWIVASSTSQSTASNGESLTYGNITVRVPAVQLNTAMTRIKDGAEGVNSESITGRDVTQQYVDLSSRLKNLEAAEQQLQTIMDEADNVTDVMSVYGQLVTTRGEIESIRGQINYFDQASAYSSIQVTLSPPTPSAVQAQTTGWNPLSTVEEAFGALIGLVRGVVDVVIFVVIVLLPPVLVIGLPAWLIYRRTRRNRPLSVEAS